MIKKWAPAPVSIPNPSTPQAIFAKDDKMMRSDKTIIW